MLSLRIFCGPAQKKQKTKKRQDRKKEGEMGVGANDDGAAYREQMERRGLDICRARAQAAEFVSAIAPSCVADVWVWRGLGVVIDRSYPLASANRVRFL